MSKTKSFWVTLPGILTGIAAIMTASGSLLFTLCQIGVIGSKPEPMSKPEPNSPVVQQPADSNVSESKIEGDFDGDGDVDFQDLAIWANNWLADVE